MATGGFHHRLNCSINGMEVWPLGMVRNGRTVRLEPSESNGLETIDFLSREHLLR